MVQRNMGTPSATERFVIGVDFGTTFTSVAYAYSGSPDVVSLVQKWPNAANNSSAYQVPTEVQYSDPATRQKRWGYDIPAVGSGSGNGGAGVLKWFKLLLQERPTGPILAHGFVPRTSGLESLFGGLGIAGNSAAAGLSSTFVPPSVTPAQRTALKLRQSNLTPVAVVTDFLAAVRETALASIEGTYGSEWTRTARKEYVLTVPAIWSDTAKSLMVKAAQDAGFGVHRVDFNLISEPEAAAAYTLRAIQPNNLECGNTFIICDAGGGTVDLISYKITNLDPLQINESVRGSGEMAGSVFLDERFEQYIRKKLGDNVVNNMKPLSRSEMMRTWEERVKFRYGVSRHGGGNFRITVAGVPDNEAAGVDCGFHTISSSEVKKIFDPVVNCIVGLVKQQVTDVTRKGERVAAILLVGGFGESEYLLQRLQSADYGTGSPIEVLQPPNARTAIARGALLRGLDGSIVKQRRSRKNYGCMSSTHFQAGRGWDSHKYWESSDERYMVDEHLNWYITRNQALEGNESTSIQFYRMVPVPRSGAQPHLIFTDELLACDLDDAPDFKWKDPSSIYRICILTSNLMSIPMGKFSKHTNSLGASYYRVDFELQMSLVDEVLKFELLFDGKCCGEVTAKFE